MIEPTTPGVGVGVVHLFYQAGPLADAEAIRSARKRAEGDADQIVAVSILGHKADLAIMGVSDDLWRLRRLQTDLAAAGLELVDSYVSLTEVSEYADGVPEEMKQARLYPTLPPPEMNAWCFYPMSKRREPEQNWYTTPFEERKEHMYEHGASGRKFRGRVVQLVTGSTGVDDYEWGVTLFGKKPDDLKEVVYTMRFDQASAVFADFGSFYYGMVAPLDDVLNSVGLT